MDKLVSVAILVLCAAATASCISIYSIQTFLLRHPAAPPEILGLVGLFGPVGAVLGAFFITWLHGALKEEIHGFLIQN